MIHVYQTPLIGWGSVIKRIFDLGLLTVTAPIWGVVLLLLVILQKLFNPGPVFFAQKRLGRFGREFNLYKFRSMKQEYSGQDPIKILRRLGREDLIEEFKRDHKIDNDPRVSRFGNLLRRSSLDELGQIINVLCGQMSLVGPRPIVADEIRKYRDRSTLLLAVKPGLTSLWAVSGRSDLPYEERMNLELYYVQNWSFWLDIKILFKTVFAVLTGRGAK
jgi:lipopolysaccharide/colanic/teichoic acid biosynthesis glycosyltransferase